LATGVVFRAFTLFATFPFYAPPDQPSGGGGNLLINAAS
jgi:hypothetical protein